MATPRKQRILFTIPRSEGHRQERREGAPQEFEIIIPKEGSKEEVLSLIGDADFFFSERSGVIDQEIIAAGKRLKLIQRVGALYYDIDLPAARRAKIPVAFWPLATCIMVAEHLLLQILALKKRLVEAHRRATSGELWGHTPGEVTYEYFVYNWSSLTGIGGIYHATIGILGFGEIAAELSKRLKNFQCTVLYNRRRRMPAVTEAELGATYATQERIITRSDVVANLLPLTPETKGLLNAAAIARMKPGAILVSCGSGGVIDEVAAAQALRSGHLGGFATDSWAYEPPFPDNPILQAPHTVLTPHIGNAGLDVRLAEDKEIYTNALRVLAGQDPQNRVA
ncbi:MAG: hypothetical protein HY335_08605 [Deinococcus sp.]|nr:hypothetical protein [Deinococcus sp.]